MDDREEIKRIPVFIDKVKRFLRSNTFKEILTFSVFIIVSFVFWFTQKSRETFEEVFEIPIEYENIPENYIFNSLPPSSFQVRVQDQGITLLSYKRNKLPPIHIDLKDKIDKENKVLISFKQFDTEIRANFSPSTQILSVTPEVVQILFAKEEEKELPVSIDLDIKPKNQFFISGDIVPYPPTVKAFGAKEKLDSLTHITTAYMEETELTDSVTLTVPLQEIEGIRFNPSQVEIFVPVEAFTETSVNLPLLTINVPEELRLITFPSQVRLTYCVPLSKYMEISPEDFTVVIDYNELIKSDNLRMQKVEISSLPSIVFNVRVYPEEVECLIEEINPSDN